MGRRAILSRESIVATGMKIVEPEGPGALTLKRLGAALGVDSTALYRHFRNKDELLSALGDHHDMTSGITEVRRSRRLVISAVHTVGNYDYGFYWYLYQDGTIELECKLTGIVATMARPARRRRRDRRSRAARVLLGQLRGHALRPARGGGRLHRHDPDDLGHRRGDVPGRRRARRPAQRR